MHRLVSVYLLLERSDIKSFIKHVCKACMKDETYEKCRECLPEIGDEVKVDGKKGTVVSLDILKKSYTVDIPNTFGG